MSKKNPFELKTQAECDREDLTYKERLIKKAKDAGREFPFQIWDQVVLIKEKDESVHGEFKRAYDAPFLVVREIYPVENGPVINWCIYACILKEEIGLTLPAHRFRILFKHNDPLYHTRYEGTY